MAISLAAVAAGGSMIVCPAGVVFAQAAVPAGNTPSAAAADLASRDVAHQSAILADANATQAQREDAARRLVSRNAPEARAALRTALAARGDPGSQRAAAAALADDAHPDPALIPALAALLGGDRDLMRAGSAALAAYQTDPHAIDAIARFATDAQGMAGPARDPARRIAIETLGSLATKSAAGTLVALINNAAESDAIHAAAGDALVDLTGLSANGRNADAWSAWWNDNRNRADDAFRDALLSHRSALLDRTVRRQDALEKAYGDLLRGQYQAADPHAKQDLLIGPAGALNSPSADARVAGIGLVRDDFRLNAQPPSPAVRNRMRQLVGDGDSSVRLAVASALGDLNDVDALNVILAQVTQENDPAVKRALVAALGPIGVPAAVPPLLQLLNDPSDDVAVAAANALQQVATASSLRESNPSLADSTAQAVIAVLQNRAARAGEEPLRYALTDTLAPLRYGPGLQLYLHLLGDQDPREREAALHALAALNDPRSADAIAALVRNDPDRSVRNAAVVALGNVGNFDYAQQMYDHMDANAESDPAVRASAWEAFRNVMRTATLDQLAQWDDRFRDQPDRQALVLQVMVDRLQRDRTARADDLATYQQRLGDALTRESTPRYADAAGLFRASLDHFWQGGGIGGAITDGLIKQEVAALLRSGQYDKAADFASEAIGHAAANQTIVGPEVLAEVGRLKTAGGGANLQNALRLIDTAKGMHNPLAARYAEMLQQDRDDVTTALTQQHPPGGRISVPSFERLLRLTPADLA